MLHHRTEDLAEKVASIAEKEAMAEVRKNGHYGGYIENWLKIYKQVLWEFVYQSELEI